MTDKIKSNEFSRSFKGIWIPSEIWLSESLSALEKILWSEIDSLYDEEKGGCYASNDYLIKFLGVKERRLQEMISNLKKLGLLVQVSFDGRERVLKAINPREVESRIPEVHKSAPLKCRKMHLSDAEKCGASYIYNKVDNKEDIYTPSKDVVNENFSLPESEKKIIRSKDVSTTDKEHKKLVEKFGEPLTVEGYQELAEWKQSATPAQVKKHKSDYYRLRKWVIPDLVAKSISHKKNLKQSVNPAEILKRKDSVMKFHRENQKNLMQTGKIFKVYDDFVTIGFDHLYYEDDNFYELVKHYLKKIGIN